MRGELSPEFVRRMVNAPGLADALSLVSKGIPYKTAMKLSPARRLAFCIILGELEGGVWDYENMCWRPPST